jgi:hypothetical protein
MDISLYQGLCTSFSTKLQKFVINDRLGEDQEMRLINYVHYKVRLWDAKRTTCHITLGIQSIHHFESDKIHSRMLRQCQPYHACYYIHSDAI